MSPDLLEAKMVYLFQRGNRQEAVRAKITRQQGDIAEESGVGFGDLTVWVTVS